MGDADPLASQQFLETIRFWTQRVFVPIFVFIGIAGNVVTVMVLTRRRMRCTTTIYLTALAVADLMYLLFVLLLSFQHYPNIHNKKFELYWRFYGITHWICDAASSASVWLTVSFTIERYIVVCHPIKGKILCTETRAKNIITLLTVLCLLTTLSTTFEHELSLTEHCVEFRNETKACDVPETLHKTVLENLSRNDSDIYDDIDTLDEELIEEGELLTNETSEECAKQMRECTLLNNTCCRVSYTIYTEPTQLGVNRTYKTIMYWFSSIIFGLLPLALIATFNCFLINSVYKSQTRRKRMTNTKESVTQNQENRITLLLIGVVILFLICQIPTASFLIYDALDGATDIDTINMKKALGNIFNFMLTLNAACNFILYCVLSNKYRKTFRLLFCERRLNRNDTLAITRTRLSQRFNPNSNVFKRSKTEIGRTPRNLEAQSLNSIPRSKSLITRPLGKAKSDDLL